MADSEPKSKKLEQKQQRRLAEQRRRDEERRAARNRNLVTIGIALLVTVLVVFLVYRDQKASQPAVGVGEKEAGCTEIKEYEPEEADHIAEGEPHEPYNSNPPTSGPHYEQPASAGFYPNELPAERVVHNLEHGQIAIYYNPDAPDQTIDQIEQVVNQEAAATLAVPWDNTEGNYNFVLAAWGASQSCADVSQDVVDAFRKRFQGRGPERIPGIPTFEG